MFNNLAHPRLPPNPPLPPHPLPQKPRRHHQFPPPPLIPLTMAPKRSSRKRTITFHRVPHKTSRGVRIHGQEEDNVEVVGVVEGFEGLLTDLGMRGRVHQEHAEQHDVPGDAAGLGVEDLDGGEGAELGALDVEEAVGGEEGLVRLVRFGDTASFTLLQRAACCGDVMHANHSALISSLTTHSLTHSPLPRPTPSPPFPPSPPHNPPTKPKKPSSHLLNIMPPNMYPRPPRQTNRHLPMPTYRLIQRQPPDLRPQPRNQMPAHRQQDQRDVERQGERRAARDPDGEVQGVEGRERGVGGLCVPSDGEEEKVQTVPEGVPEELAVGGEGGEVGSDTVGEGGHGR